VQYRVQFLAYNVRNIATGKYLSIVGLARYVNESLRPLPGRRRPLRAWGPYFISQYPYSTHNPRKGVGKKENEATYVAMRRELNCILLQ
jgi:hypothetical protein